MPPPLTSLYPPSPIPPHNPPWDRGDSSSCRRDQEEDEEIAAAPKGVPQQKKKRRRLVIYQRDTDRTLLDLESNVETLKELLGPEWRVVSIVHDNDHAPCWLYSQLMDADMLLTPHGYVVQ